MAYTVKQLAALSGVSVRTLHFYDETGLLKPACVGANGYRFYDEPQLLMLQQILFYRELGFELKRIKEILGSPDFEKLAALQAHREMLEQDLSRTRTLIETIDKTIAHLKGARTMKSEELFEGFSVAAGEDRFGEGLMLADEPVDCKLSAQDTDGAMCIFENNAGWPYHSHHDQDEWIYVVQGQIDLVVGSQRSRLGVGESVFIPRKTLHMWSPVAGGKIISVNQPAGKIEAFLRKVAEVQKELPTRDQVVTNTFTEAQVAMLHRLFRDHGMALQDPRPFLDRGDK